MLSRVKHDNIVKVSYNNIFCNHIMKVLYLFSHMFMLLIHENIHTLLQYFVLKFTLIQVTEILQDGFIDRIFLTALVYSFCLFNCIRTRQALKFGRLATQVSITLNRHGTHYKFQKTAWSSNNKNLKTSNLYPFLVRLI